jgi:hypothetical protein
MDYFSRVKLNSVLVEVLVCYPSEISTHDYVSVSTQMQRQNAMWLRQSFGL